MLADGKRNLFEAYQVIWCSTAKNYGNKLYLKLKKTIMVRIPKTATQVECNSSYFKLSIFEKAEVGCRNLEIESLELYFAKTSNFKFTGKIN